jgi:hypothetical protein
MMDAICLPVDCVFVFILTPTQAKHNGTQTDLVVRLSDEVDLIYKIPAKFQMVFYAMMPTTRQ